MGRVKDENGYWKCSRATDNSGVSDTSKATADRGTLNTSLPRININIPWEKFVEAERLYWQDRGINVIEPTFPEPIFKPPHRPSKGWQEKYIFPVELSYPMRVVNSWGQERGKNRRHEGVDIMHKEGAEVYAITDGVVRVLVEVTLAISADDGCTYIYRNMLKFANEIRNGVHVRAGQTIGYLGPPGVTALRPHLYFQACFGKKKSESLKNPYQLLAQIDKNSSKVSNDSVPYESIKPMLPAKPIYGKDLIPGVYQKKGWDRYYFFPVERPVSFNNSWRDKPTPHHGIDIYPLKKSNQVEVYAIASGVISDIPNIWLILRGKDGCEYFYCHLQGFSPLITPYSHVKKGQLLGYIGTTGMLKNYPHLHFEAFPDYRVKKRANPYNFLLELLGGKGDEKSVKVIGESTRFMEEKVKRPRR